MITKPKGCYDVTGDASRKYQRICDVVSAYAKIYNYKYIRTPLFESTELFKRGVGDTTDIVQKETYDFTDRGGRSFTFRTIEFEQMEYQTFCKPGMDHDIYEYYKDYGKRFFESLGLPTDKLRFKDHKKLAHYAKEACDIEYLFPFGWGEINGTHNRTDFDLTRHQEYSGKKLEYFDPYTQEKYIPFIIESTYGLDRTILALLCESLHKLVDENGKERFVLSLDKSISPMKVSILPLEKKNHSELAMNLYRKLRKEMMVYYDDKGNIGKRYKNSDAIGTPYSICVDNDTLENGMLTIRDRDTRNQIKVSTVQVEDVLKRKLVRK